MRFTKLVAIEPVNITDEAKASLSDIADEVVLWDSVPADNEEIACRIGDADAVLISYTSRLEGEVMKRCSNLRYVGMCCSLYSEESANVDIPAARDLGIEVSGVRDYGDEGVLEYVVAELVRYLHGYGDKRFDERGQVEIGDLAVGVVGMGTSGTLIARGLQFLGAQVSYFSRTRKPELEAEGFAYLELDDLLRQADAVFTCLNKNVILLDEDRFKALGHHKILFNTSIGPGHDVAALKAWLDAGNGEYFCDTPAALAPDARESGLLAHPRVNCVGVSSGSTLTARVRLGEKVLKNIEGYLSSAG